MHSYALHVVDLSSAKLVCVFDRTFTNLLIENGHVDIILHCFFVSGICIILIAFVSVLISLYKSRNSYN